MDISFCNGCVYGPMCGRKKDVKIAQDRAAQAVKREDRIFNFTGCLDRKLADEKGKDVVRILINGVDIEEGDKNAVETANG